MLICSRAHTSDARPSGGCPGWVACVPAESTRTARSLLRWCNASLNTAAAMGERQILALHTINTEVEGREKRFIAPPERAKPVVYGLLLAGDSMPSGARGVTCKPGMGNDNPYHHQKQNRVGERRRAPPHIALANLQPQ